MKVNYIHDFTQTTEEEFLKIQNELKEKVVLSSKLDIDKIKTVAGVDIAYWECEDKSYGACSIVIIDYITKEVLERVEAFGEIKVPYVAGFLAFRELPLILEAVEKITVEPDVFMFDGNGYLHYNNMGVATHASFFLDKPVIGVAKTYLRVNGVDFTMPGEDIGNYTDIVVDGKVLGRAVRSGKKAKPIFVSCGNNISLEDSYEVTVRLLNKESRIPIPTRIADLETHKLRKKYNELQNE
jgi:Deoxyinosine 3''endonuclease (endonuclease V)